MKILNDLQLFLKLIPIVLKGWANLFLKMYLKLAEFWNEKNMLEKSIFVLLFIQLAFSAQGWVDYSVNFNQQENISVSVKMNIFFILFSLINFFFVGFWRSFWVKYIFVTLQSIMVIILIAGFIDPSWLFVDFKKNSDYQFNWMGYVFAIVLLVNTASFFLMDDSGSKI
ncbi:MAG: hypothetical protein K8R21_16245 [Leptospira sp.]|nr:hypothetical protein [Leptospira sp.]